MCNVRGDRSACADPMLCALDTVAKKMVCKTVTTPTGGPCTHDRHCSAWLSLDNVCNQETSTCSPKGTFQDNAKCSHDWQCDRAKDFSCTTQKKIPFRGEGLDWKSDVDTEHKFVPKHCEPKLSHNHEFNFQWNRDCASHEDCEGYCSAMVRPCCSSMHQ